MIYYSVIIYNQYKKIINIYFFYLDKCLIREEVKMKSVHLNNLVELVPRVLDRMGKYQIFIIVLLSFNSAIVAINHTVTSFHIYTPTFHCSVSNLFGYLGISSEKPEP